ncbi:PREDICTED: uncharacterized protein LOC109481454 [Branchiostoma belcheri]|uniref:Uncharacterized protein LOC109481454 n=1 Tax=Branchiostoma belcheri TaxID=7741 RepID=A0A6P5ACT6_BRABE|nr:PREDICTED: uncharacterized protein LOC109481454 [Branchiostoma belcheri]
MGLLCRVLHKARIKMRRKIGQYGMTPVVAFLAIVALTLYAVYPSLRQTPVREKPALKIRDRFDIRQVTHAITTTENVFKRGHEGFLKKLLLRKHEGQKSGIQEHSNKEEPQHTGCRRPELDLYTPEIEHWFHDVEPLKCEVGQKELIHFQNDVIKIDLDILPEVMKDFDDFICIFRSLYRRDEDYTHFDHEQIINMTGYTKTLLDFNIDTDFFEISCGENPRHHDYKDGYIYNLPDTDMTKNVTNANDGLFEEHQNALFEERQDNETKILRKLLDEPDGDNNDAEDEDDDEEDDENEYSIKYRRYNYHDYDDYDYTSLRDVAYEMLFSHIHPKPTVFADAKQKLLKDTALGLNVLMFGFDSTSRLNFIRKLPKTYKYMTEILDSAVLTGYNIIGDATTAALIPMLTGQTEMELPEVRKNQDVSHSVDIYPLVWKEFKKNGYATLFAEDQPTMSVFNLRLNGFEKQPTDHYMRPFWLEVDYSELAHGNCLGSKPKHDIMLEYIMDFQEKYKDLRRFTFGFFSDLSHGDINPLAYADDSMLQFLQSLYRDGYLKNTMLVIFGDHGARYGKIRSTFQGRLEERLPFMSITLPTEFQKQHPEIAKNLKSNAAKLTTPFNIHSTLLDILNYKSGNAYPYRGQSLFREVPENMTCTEAGIATHWCTCMEWEELDTGQDHVVQASRAVVDFINEQTLPYRSLCSQLDISAIKRADLVTANEQVLRFNGTRDEDQRLPRFGREVNVKQADIQVILETSPSNALFEATVTVSFKLQTYTVHGISRINMYGDQPHCIMDQYPHIRQYCYCKSQPALRKKR